MRYPVADPPWTESLNQLIQQHPTFGYRQLWVLLRVHEGISESQSISCDKAERVVCPSARLHATPIACAAGGGRRAPVTNGGRWMPDILPVS
jgi:hypothetical protein